MSKSYGIVFLIGALVLGLALINGGGENVTNHDQRLLEDLY